MPVLAQKSHSRLLSRTSWHKPTFDDLSTSGSEPSRLSRFEPGFLVKTSIFVTVGKRAESSRERAWIKRLFQAEKGRVDHPPLGQPVTRPRPRPGRRLRAASMLGSRLRLALRPQHSSGWLVPRPTLRPARRPRSRPGLRPRPAPEHGPRHLRPAPRHGPRPRPASRYGSRCQRAAPRHGWRP